MAGAPCEGVRGLVGALQVINARYGRLAMTLAAYCMQAVRRKLVGVEYRRSETTGHRPLERLNIVVLVIWA